MKKLFIPVDRSYKKEQFMYEKFFLVGFLLFKVESTEMLVTSLKSVLMDCYGHWILVKMCYAIVRKPIFTMTFTVLVEHIKEKV